MTVRAILLDKGRKVTSIDASSQVVEAVRMLATARIGAVPVVEGDRVVGIFSERDVIYCLEKHGADALAKRVGDVMTAPPVTVEPDTDVIVALSLMTRRRIRHLPVVEGERMTGFVSIGDLVKYRVDRIEGEASALRDYIAS